MSHLNETTGPLVIGVSLNLFCYGILTCQYFRYCVTEFNDPWWIKLLVCVLCLLDTVHVVAMAYAVWSYSSQTYYDVEALFSLWPYMMTTLILVITAFLVQAFLTYRIYRLTKCWIGYVIISLLSLVAWAVGIFSSARIIMLNSIHEAIKLRTAATLCLFTEIVADWVIAAVLITLLLRSRTGFTKSNELIYRLVRATVQTGFLAGIFTLVSLFLFMKYPGSHYYGILGLSVGRVYSATLMDTVLVRHSLRKLVRGGKTPTSAIWELQDLGPLPRRLTRNLTPPFRTDNSSTSPPNP